MKNKQYKVLLIAFLLLASCRQARSADEPSPEIFNARDEADSTFTICLGDEPQSLYPLGLTSQAGRDVLQAIYDGPIDMLNGQPVPVILEELPGLDDSTAQATPLEVQTGDEVINTAGQPVVLRAGTRVFPSGCRSASCAINWDGSTPLQLDQWSVIFQLKDGLRWSDGQPLRADDSVYGYRVASDPATPGDGRAVEVTASYRALDERRVEWVGKAGLVVESFAEYFWMPLPEHVWGGYSGRELLEAEETTRRPLGWGAYMVEEWQTGVEIRLERNPYYWRADENLPVYDTLIFKITNSQGDTNIANLKFDRNPFEVYNLDVGEMGAEVEKSGCDLISTAVDMRDQLEVFHILTHYYQQPSIRVFPGSYGELEVLLMNTAGWREANLSPLASSEVRQAISLCLDREKAIQELSFGFFSLPAVIPLAGLPQAVGTQPPGGSNAIPYDPLIAAQMLDQLGWRHIQGQEDGPRASSDVEGISDNQQLGFVYAVEERVLSVASAQIFKQSLENCGMGINIRVVPPEQFWDPDHEHSVFQGQYDLVQLSWYAPIENPCTLLTLQDIDTQKGKMVDDNLALFDHSLSGLCEQLQGAYFLSDRQALLTRIQTLLHTEKPAIPLFYHPRWIVTRSDFCGEASDFSASSQLVHLEEFRYSPTCP